MAMAGRFFLGLTCFNETGKSLLFSTNSIFLTSLLGKPTLYPVANFNITISFLGEGISIPSTVSCLVRSLTLSPGWGIFTLKRIKLYIDYAAPAGGGTD